MSSRKEQKQRLREERLAKEQQRRREERRRRLRIAGAAALAGTLAVAGLVALRPWDAGSQDAFGYSPDGAAERAERAGMTPGSGPHVHPKLNVVVREKTIAVPGNMGLTPGMQPMHTHEADGTIHVEGAKDGTLGHFMALWGVRFGRGRLGPYRAKGSEAVRMWVKEPKAPAFEEVIPDPSLTLEDGQEIYVYFGRPSQTPIKT